MPMARRGVHAAAAAETLNSSRNSHFGWGPRARSPMLKSSTSAAASLYGSGSFGFTNSFGNNSARPLSAPRTGARPGTPGKGIGLNTEVRVESCPMTHQGMISMHTPFQGPRQQIPDKSYFIRKVRAKKQELQNEITTMTMEIEHLQKRGSTNIQLDNQQDVLLRAVKLLKGKLGDYNMVMESVAAGTELEQLKDIVGSLKEKNDIERKKISQLFIDRSQKEKEANTAEETYLSTMVELERQLGREGPEKHAKFTKAMEENKFLNGEVENLESKLEELVLSIEPLEQDLEKMPQANQKKLTLVEQLLSAQEELKQMQEKNASLPQPSPMEVGDAMPSKIWNDSAKIASAKAKSRELENEIQLYEEKFLATEKVLNELKGGRAEKFVEMQQKEKKMQSFLDKYEATFHEHMTAKKTVEKNIVHLLERINQVDCSSSSTKSNDDNDKGSSDNVEKLTEDLETQREELKQLEEMEAKTMREVEMSKQKIVTFKNEIEKLMNLDEVLSGLDSKCLELEAQKKATEEERSRMQVQIKEQNVLIESLQQQLRESPLHKNIEALNQKLLVLQQNITKTQEELEMKERELNYKPVLENIGFMVRQLNEEIQSKLNPKT